jgi:hypothetical protein
MLVSFSMQAQRKKTVRATGTAISHDLTPEQTRAKAIEDAKRNALNKAGVSESISFTDFSYKFEDNEKFGEIFQAISMIETGGEIVVDEILNESKDFNEFGNMVVEVEIKATVYRHKKSADPTFLFKIEGIDEVYQNEDLLQFKITPTQDGYLKIFNITEDATTLLYPYKDLENPQYNDKTDQLFKANETVQLPLHPAYSDGYYLEVDAPGKSQEFTILMFVFTKQNIPFIEEPTFNNMMSWIYAISPDERVIGQEGFVIKK